MYQIFGIIWQTLFIILIITQFKTMIITSRFRSMKYNDNKYSMVSFQELQEAINIARNSEDELFLRISFKWVKLHTILFFIWIILLIFLVIINLNDW